MIFYFLENLASEAKVEIVGNCLHLQRASTGDGAGKEIRSFPWTDAAEVKSKGKVVWFLLLSYLTN